MDSKPPTNPPPKKMKFVPKARGRGPPKPIVPKPEAVDDVDAFEKEELMRMLNESRAGKPKYERKSEHARVTFGGGASKAYSNYILTKPSSSRNQDGVGKPKKEYQEPWNYESYYPVTLPLRRPYSGNLDELDEKEFKTPSESQANTGTELDEKESGTSSKSQANTGIQLGLMDETCEPRLMLIQLPKMVPMLRQEGSSNAADQRKCAFTKDLPGGLVGKLLVYKSGKVKLKLGETLYDVNPGSDCKFAEDCVAINTKEKHCPNLGQIHKHIVVTPDVDSILDSIENADVVAISGLLEGADIG